MKTSYIAACIALVGAAATFAALNGFNPKDITFNATVMTEAEHEFIKFIAEYRRFYGTKEEYDYRLEQFTKAYNHIKTHNAKNASYNLAINNFADMDDFEYNQLLGYKYDSTRVQKNVRHAYDLTTPSEVNWVTAGAVTAVKNQGSCGSCWSFSTTGAVEGAFQITNGELLSFSEQQLVDCDKGLTLNHGCNGGLMDLAFEYLENAGSEQESDYSYKGKVGTCEYDQGKVKSYVTGYSDVKSESYKALLEAVAEQPVSIAIEADKLCFQFYKSGVLTSDDCKCGDSLDHGVLLVGYGTENGVDYWLVKNSWDTTWGDEGYIKLERDGQDGSGMCGLQLQPSYPKVKKA